MKIKAYKALDKDFKCRGFQFEVGMTYTNDKGVKVCDYGFHACKNPADVLNYYDLVYSRFAEVELSGDISECDSDTKLAGSVIEIIREISAHDFTIEMVRYAVAQDDVVSDHYSQLSASGYHSQLSASGYRSQLSASGNYSQLSASDHYSQLSASGDHSQLSAPGDYSVIASASYGGQFKSGLNGAVAQVYKDETGKNRFFVGYVGENIKADTWYEVNAKGEAVECAK